MRARLAEDEVQSTIYFEGLAGKNPEVVRKLLSNIEHTLDDDLAKQIAINAHIATIKFRSYNRCVLSIGLTFVFILSFTVVALVA